MTTIIHTQGLVMTPRLKAHLTRRLTFALYRFENRINRTDVYVKDQSGGKAGTGKSVVAQVHLNDGVRVVVEATGHDSRAAINVAAKRAKRAVKRALKTPLAHRRVDLGKLTMEGA
ncbi:MAG: HPF/RaiA family ribosome-associated protein [Xanthomonadales bacterium]|jgi:ribosome-associated translation inhibitor RaiA|nr:HPF/RaiA family ribosome-associated protein [Xanthomonadales bacterium]